MNAESLGPPQPAEEFYWRSRDESLRADAPAVGGEPCRICEQPIAPSALRLHRERMVCSSHCNHLLSRRWNRKRQQGQVDLPTTDVRESREVDQERERPPMLFRTVQDSEFPYEHARWTKHGDVVERHGEETLYLHEGEDFEPSAKLLEYAEWLGVERQRILYAVHLRTGIVCPTLTEASGRPARMLMPVMALGDELVKLQVPVEFVDGSFLYFGREFINDIDDDGLYYRWEAWAFWPVQLPGKSLATPRRLAFVQSRKRATGAVNNYRARLRALGIHTDDGEYIDPIAVYERDGWQCGVCGEPIEPQLKWPHPNSVTLDHVVAVSKGGLHEAENLQAAHWMCNVLKGSG